MDIKYIAACQKLESLGYVWRFDEWTLVEEQKTCDDYCDDCENEIDEEYIHLRYHSHHETSTDY